MTIELVQEGPGLPLRPSSLPLSRKLRLLNENKVKAILNIVKKISLETALFKNKSSIFIFQNKIRIAVEFFFSG